jgi:hypothetical protein
VANYLVMPAQAGIQRKLTEALRLEVCLDLGLRRGDAEAGESAAQ